MRGIIFQSMHSFTTYVITMQIRISFDFYFRFEVTKIFFLNFSTPLNARKIKIEAFKKNNSQGKERIGGSIAAKGETIFHFRFRRAFRKNRALSDEKCC